MIVKFVNRREELEELGELLKRKRAALVLLYGRRRVGKTRLIQEFLRDKRSLYFYIPNAGEGTILAELSHAVESEFFKGFRFADFRSFMEYLAGKLEDGVIVAIDEFQRLTRVDGAISMLQRYWDERASKASWFLVLSGSSMGMMRRVALSRDAPLYGRRAATLKIKPLKYLDLFKWFERYSAEELVRIYGSFGGTPAYLEHVDEGVSVDENVVEKILSKRSPLYDEPEMLLMEEVRAPQRYMDILSAIATGRNTVSEIANATRLTRENITTYLRALEILDLIERITPVTEPEAKRGLYRIMDPFFRFWFAFVRPNKRRLELGLERAVWEDIRDEFNTYLGSVFEDVCREALLEMAKRDVLPVRVSGMGRWWSKDAEIDVLAVGNGGRRALAVEVKWAELSYAEARRLLLGLEAKTQKVRGPEEFVLGVAAKRLEGKEKLKGEGFLALDLSQFPNEILTPS